MNFGHRSTLIFIKFLNNHPKLQPRINIYIRIGVYGTDLSWTWMLDYR